MDELAKERTWHDWYTDREWLLHRLTTVLKWAFVLSVLMPELKEERDARGV